MSLLSLLICLRAYSQHGAPVLTGDFAQQQAYWLDRSRVVIRPTHFHPTDRYAISWRVSGGMHVTKSGVSGGDQIPLVEGGSLTRDELMRYPQLAGYSVLTVSAGTSLVTIQQALKGQLILASVNRAGQLTYATGMQYAPILDDLYYYPGPLGVVIHHQMDAPVSGSVVEDNAPVQLKLWAPTAQNVSLLLYDRASDASPSSTTEMQEHNGVWSASGSSAWIGKYYLYSVSVYVPSVQSMRNNITSDPYSIDLALNGMKSRITDLDSEGTKPAGWDKSASPPLNSLNDLSIYELHVRDFSIGDPTVPVAHRGMYEAFSDENSKGMSHLRTLVQSGLKAVHLLPTFHFSPGSVDENKSTWQSPFGLAPNPPDGEQQQAAVAAVQNYDAYNWGYDPVHYMAPEGSYAINPDNRVYEYRTMVQALHRTGLRVIQDVVFNHTDASGEGPNSNLDAVVPLYYHRLDANGELQTGSCCPDTASEHRMMEKLMTDTLLLYAREYKIDGFRFDLMSMHFTYNLADIRKALNSLTLLKDGVDGSKIYLYGEGWNFSETADDALGPNASQRNLYGYDVGTFNDRIRDGIRGDNGSDQVQGFATGLWTDPSEYTKAALTPGAQQTMLLQQEDWIRVSLAGNLRDFTFTSYTGAKVTGAEVTYRGTPAGYTAMPIEAVNYCSAHDDIDLFDAIQLKSSLDDSAAIRARRQVLAMSLIALGQAVPFFQGGDDLLRSKDMDPNSYDSGDWFNKIDWSGKANNWGLGLPMESQSRQQWSIMQPLLASASYTPRPTDIALVRAAFQEFLLIRYSSGLFRMPTLVEIQRNLSFLNIGKDQIPGLIVMTLDASGEADGPYKHIVVFFNARSAQTSFHDVRLRGMRLHLHPVQQNSNDSVIRRSNFDASTGTANIPALTTSVFVSE